MSNNLIRPPSITEVNDPWLNYDISTNSNTSIWDIRRPESYISEEMLRDMRRLSTYTSDTYNSNTYSTSTANTSLTTTWNTGTAPMNVSATPRMNSFENLNIVKDYMHDRSYQALIESGVREISSRITQRIVEIYEDIKEKRFEINTYLQEFPISIVQPFQLRAMHSGNVMNDNVVTKLVPAAINNHTFTIPYNIDMSDELVQGQIKYELIMQQKRMVEQSIEHIVPDSRRSGRSGFYIDKLFQEKSRDIEQYTKNINLSALFPIKIDSALNVVKLDNSSLYPELSPKLPPKVLQLELF